MFVFVVVCPDLKAPVMKETMGNRKQNTALRRKTTFSLVKIERHLKKERIKKR